MSKISKVGLIMCLLAFLIMCILFLLQQIIPNLVIYLFVGGLVLNFVGIFMQARKNKQL